MKTFTFFLLMVTALGGCKKETDAMKEVPNGVIRVQTCPTLYSRIVELFPEGVNAKTHYPFLFSDTVTKELRITTETEVYVSFVAEGASFKNTLGWYSYNIDSVPQTSKDFVQHILFPNVSGIAEGGLLNAGDMLQLGSQKFAAGTVIGFFLIENGWENGSINYGNIFDFTNANFNVNKVQQMVLFKERNCKDIILSFEDMSDNEPTDRDFNDVIISISDNKKGYESISFDLLKTPTL